MPLDLLTASTISPSLPSDTYTDQALLQACLQGNPQAWEQLLRKYERLVFSVARNCGLTPEDAADITQITFTYLLQSLDNVREDHLGGWLVTVARRHSWRVCKQQQRNSEEEIDSEAIHELFPHYTTTNPIERWELVEWIQQSLAQIGERCQRLLIALYFDTKEPSYREISETLGVPEGSIGPTRARCLSQLRRVLEKADEK